MSVKTWIPGIGDDLTERIYLTRTHPQSVSAADKIKLIDHLNTGCTKCGSEFIVVSECPDLENS